VTLAGRRLSVLGDREATLVRRHNIGFVFQFFNLLPTLTAQENVALPLLIDGQNIGDHRERIDRLLSLVGLSDRRDHKPAQLSGGEQQRVALARALVTEPAVVLADEPTGNLDSRTGTAIMELLQRSCIELNQALIAVTHDARAATYAHRVVFLRDGQIVEEIHFAAGEEMSARLKRVMQTIEALETDA
jgi:putative ABC transport system ATP-binding protein